jgi:hypothetical protein
MEFLNKKGQVASIETIMLVGIVLATSIPISVLTVDGLNDKWSEGIRVQEAAVLRDAIETVSRLGPGNSIAVASINGYSILDNRLIYNEESSIPLTPSIEDYTANGGIIEIINTDEGIFIGNSPEIKIIDGSDRTNIKILGENFDEGMTLLLDGEKGSLNFVSDKEVTFSMSKSGKFEVQLLRTVGDKELISEVVEIKLGGVLNKKSKVSK